ncbi:MAG: type II toxin-antitoxin system antitoxin MazE7 [Candidatus Rokuibacteriota bacterium]
MATETATIRVPRATRDQLTRRAQERGVSLSAMLTEYAEALAREAIYRSEREATRADAQNAAVTAEEREWETVIADGIE